MSAMIRKLLLVLLVAAVATPLAGCGRKTSNIPPPDSKYPRNYPTR